MPRTDAGKSLLDLLQRQSNATDSQSWRNGLAYAEECIEISLPRIEAQAVAAERERITREAKGMSLPIGPNFEGIDLHPEIIRAVLAIVNPEADR